MATNIFMNLGNKIQGESEDEHHEGWCEITDLGQKFSQKISPLKSGRGSQAEYESLNVTKYSDSATTEILKVCWKGTILPNVEIICYRADGSNNPIDYLKIELKNVIISKYKLKVSGGNLPVETLELDYTSVTYTYKKVDKKSGKARSGEPGRKIAGHDRVENRTF